MAEWYDDNDQDHTAAIVRLLMGPGNLNTSPKPYTNSTGIPTGGWPDEMAKGQFYKPTDSPFAGDAAQDLTQMDVGRAPGGQTWNGFPYGRNVAPTVGPSSSQPPMGKPHNLPLPPRQQRPAPNHLQRMQQRPQQYQPPEDFGSPYRR